MKIFLILLLAALLASSIGFHNYVWFISIGYGAAIALIGALMVVIYHNSLTIATALQCVLLIAYGLRLSGYLAYREIKSGSYKKAMKKEISSDSSVTGGVKCAIWISASLLYVCEISPILFRLENGIGTSLSCLIGIVISACGLILESAADYQKNEAKKKNPHRFVDSGLYRFVRCPNYLGELTFWTGVFVSAFHAVHGTWQWIAAIAGYAGIFYVMFGGARRLEIRQNKNYGADPEYQKYVKSVPILLPFVHLYSVEKYKWLVG